MFMLFVLFMLSNAAEISLTIGGSAQIGPISITIDETKIDQVIDKCINTNILSFKLTKEAEAYKLLLFKDQKCPENGAYVSIPLSKLENAITKVEDLADKLQETVIEGGVEVKLITQFGCLSKLLKDVNVDVAGNLNTNIVKTQFGVSIHTTGDAECTIDQGIKAILSNTSQALENVKAVIGGLNITIPTEQEFMDHYNKAKNMFKKMAKETYDYVNTELPKKVDDLLYEFNGTAMTIYKKGKDVYEKVEEVFTKENIKNYLTTVKQQVGDALEDVVITADCDGDTSFAWSNGQLQQLKFSSENQCNIDVSSSLFNMKVNVNVGSETKNNEIKININNEEFIINEEEVKKHISNAKEAVVESFGSFLDFELNVCKPVNVTTMLKSFNEFVSGIIPKSFSNLIKDFSEETMNALSIDKFIEKLSENPLISTGLDLLKQFSITVQDFLPQFSYNIGSIELGKDKQKFATFEFYYDGTKVIAPEKEIEWLIPSKWERKETLESCSGKPLFQLIVGAITETGEIDKEYYMEMFMEEKDCLANMGSNGIYTQYLQLDGCYNGYKYTYADGQLMREPCSDKKEGSLKKDDKAVVIDCDKCIQCQIEALQGTEYSYVTCGANTIFTFMLIALLFFIF